MPSLRKLRLNSYTQSKPPTISRLRYNSLATRMYISMSKALWCVMKGRAVAPPGMVWSTGVSTSNAPRASRKSRMLFTILVRWMKVSLTPALTTRSTYRIRWRSSGSTKASCTLPSASIFTMGNGRRDLHRRMSDWAWTVISPVRVRKTKPSMPIKSPMSKSFLKNSSKRRLSSPGQISSRRTYIWMRPEESCNSAKQAFPMSRTIITRPARRIFWNPSAPSSKRALISAAEAFSSKSSAG